MSADNWAVCPRCVKRQQAKVVELEANVASVYGEVSADEFMLLNESLASTKAAAAKGPEPTFREDYETYGAEDGIVVFEYSGTCNVCGLKATGRYEIVLDVDGGVA